MDNNVLLYSTGNYVQCPGINHNGKEYKKEKKFKAPHWKLKYEHGLTNRLSSSSVKASGFHSSGNFVMGPLLKAFSIILILHSHAELTDYD